MIDNVDWIQPVIAYWHLVTNQNQAAFMDEYQKHSTLNSFSELYVDTLMFLWCFELFNSWYHTNTHFSHKSSTIVQRSPQYHWIMITIFKTTVQEHFIEWSFGMSRLRWTLTWTSLRTKAHQTNRTWALQITFMEPMFHCWLSLSHETYSTHPTFHFERLESTLSHLKDEENKIVTGGSVAQDDLFSFSR